MKFVSFDQIGKDRLGLLIDGYIYETSSLFPGFPDTMQALLNNWDKHFEKLSGMHTKIREGYADYYRKISFEQAKLLCPVPYPNSCRDGYAFRQHVEAARRNRGLIMIDEYDRFPVFYFGNHRTVTGPGTIRCMEDHFKKLDYELEVAIVICRQGINIKASDADNYIGGLMIMNDWSARQLQKEEMMLNLGPAKGKDFATSYGPFLITPDELKDHEIHKDGHTGASWDLRMSATVNGVTLSYGNVKDMDWTFAEIIERASYGVTLYPGDIIGSGTVGTGCLLELNGTGKLADQNYREQWLQEGDIVQLAIEQLGVLKNTIAKETVAYSLPVKELLHDH